MTRNPSETRSLSEENDQDNNPHSSNRSGRLAEDPGVEDDEQECHDHVRSSRNEWVFSKYINLIVIPLAIFLASILVTLGLDAIDHRSPHPLWWGLAFIPFFAGATSAFVPATIPTLMAGFLFRPVYKSILIVLVGSQLAIYTSYHLGKLLRPWVEKKLYSDPRFEAIDRAIAKRGWKIVVLLRISPMAPFGITNYILSLSSTPLYEILFGSLIGNAPGAILYSFLGSFMSDLNESVSYKLPFKTKLIGGIVSGSVGIITVVYVTIIAQKALEKAMMRKRSVEELDDDNESFERRQSPRSTTPLLSEERSVPRQRPVSPSRGVSLPIRYGDMDDDEEIPWTRREKQWLYGSLILCSVLVVIGIPIIYYKVE